MTISILNRVTVGSAKALTQGDITGKYLEANFMPSRVPA